MQLPTLFCVPIPAAALAVGTLPAIAQPGQSSLAAPAADADDDARFLAAREAFRLGNRARLESLSAGLRQYVLADYLDYYALRLGLDQQDPAVLSAFLARQEGSLLAERLRADWLKVLARQGDWSSLAQQFAALKAPDQEARCLGIQARLNLGEASARPEAEQLWQSLVEPPDACLPLFAQLAANADSEAIWRRARLLAEANKPARLALLLRALPTNEQPDAKQLDLLLDKPPVWLARFAPANPQSRTAQELVALAVQRLARNDPAFAAAELQRRGDSLAPALRAWAWGQIGLQAARRHMPEALAWYRQSRPEALSLEAAEWQVRAALRLLDWKAVRDAILSLPAEARDKPEWLYWLGRADLASGRADEARSLFSRLSGQANFYGNLADEELGRPIAMPPRAEAPRPAEIAAARQNPGLARALALFRLDLRTEAVREWNWAIRDMDDRQLLAAAELARQNQLYDRAINTAERTRSQHDFTLRYLAPYDAQVRPAARDQALDDAWVYGLMRQESRFVTQARSVTGAAGLMQLMPNTARWVAKKIGLKDYDHRRVSDPEINLLLGTSYMRMVMENLDNHPVLASAAYNAGPGRARKWRADVPLEGAIYAETIPFSETRDYVKKVMSNAVYYSVLFNGRPASLHERLGIVPPRAGGEPPANADLP